MSTLGNVNETPQMEARSQSNPSSNSTRNYTSGGRYPVSQFSGGSLPYGVQGSNYPAVSSSGKKSHSVQVMQAAVPVPIGAAPAMELKNKSLEEEVKQYAARVNRLEQTLAHEKKVR